MPSSNYVINFYSIHRYPTVVLKQIEPSLKISGIC